MIDHSHVYDFYPGYTTGGSAFIFSQLSHHILIFKSYETIIVESRDNIAIRDNNTMHNELR